MPLLRVPFAIVFNLSFNRCLVNYTGSIGFGDDSIDALEGQIGIRDVEDCYVDTKRQIDSLFIF